MTWLGETRRPAFGLALALLFSLSACSSGDDYGGGNNAPPAPPSATIALTPPPGTSINRTTNVRADVNAPAGVTRIEFLVDRTVVGTVTAAPYTFDWDTSPTPDGPHSLTARLTDGAGRIVTSADVAVTVRNHLSIPIQLSPDQIFPRPVSTASASGQITFDLISGAITGGVTTVGFVPTNAHIHEAYAGADGAPVVPFGKNIADPQRWEAPAGSMLTAEGINALLAGKLYVNVHSDAYKAGEVRAQIATEDVRVAFTRLTGDAIVPSAVMTAAGGLAATTVDTLTGQATVNANLSGVVDPTLMHVHKGGPTVNVETILLALTRDTVSLEHWSTGTQSIAAADLEAFTRSAWYIDLHTATNADGLLRGQVKVKRFAGGLR